MAVFLVLKAVEEIPIRLELFFEKRLQLLPALIQVDDILIMHENFCCKGFEVV